MAGEIDTFQRRRGQQRLETSRFGGAETFAQERAHFGLAFRIAERFDDAAYERSILLANIHFEADNSLPFQSAAIDRKGLPL